MNLLRQILIGTAPEHFALGRHELADPWIVETPAPSDGMGFQLVSGGNVLVTSDEDDRPMCLLDGDLMVILRAMGRRLIMTPSADTIDHNYVGSRHRPRFSTQTPATLFCGGFTFVAAPVHPVLADLPWCLIVRRKELSEYPRLDLVVRLIRSVLEASSAPSTDTQLLLLESLFHFVFMYWAERDARFGHWNTVLQDPRLVHVLGLMFAEPGKWDVNTIAGECGLSRTGFRRLFMAAVGESPGPYLSRLRVERAKELLKGTNLSLTQIAENVGYADPFSLSKAFKRFQGCSPQEYRQGTSELHLPSRRQRPRAV